MHFPINPKGISSPQKNTPIEQGNAQSEAVTPPSIHRVSSDRRPKSREPVNDSSETVPMNDVSRVLPPPIAPEAKPADGKRHAEIEQNVPPIEEHPSSNVSTPALRNAQSNGQPLSTFHQANPNEAQQIEFLMQELPTLRERTGEMLRIGHELTQSKSRIIPRPIKKRLNDCLLMLRRYSDELTHLVAQIRR